MLVEKDNIHISLRELDGYNLPFNFVVCEREAGKSTELVSKVYKIYKNGGVSLVFKRNVVDITDEYINSFNEIINKFYDEDFKLYYKQGEKKEGIVRIKDKEGKTIFILLALSVKISRIKSLVLRNIKAMFFDEFICNPEFNERYLPNEANKFKEAYNTFYRESEVMIKCYFFGNPYSMHNPYFMTWGIDLQLLKKGEISIQKNIAIWCYDLTPELREYILKRNPLYEFDESYKKYAFFGKAVNDEHIRISILPINYSLKYLFKIDGKYIGVYQNRYYEDREDRFYCQFEDNPSKYRSAYCYDFEDLIERTSLISIDDKERFYRFKDAMRKNKVTFKDINVYYLIIELYKNI